MGATGCFRLGWWISPWDGLEHGHLRYPVSGENDRLSLIAKTMYQKTVRLSILNLFAFRFISLFSNLLSIFLFLTQPNYYILYTNPLTDFTTCGIVLLVNRSTVLTVDPEQSRRVKLRAALERLETTRERRESQDDKRPGAQRSSKGLQYPRSFVCPVLRNRRARLRNMAVKASPAP